MARSASLRLSLRSPAARLGRSFDPGLSASPFGQGLPSPCRTPPHASWLRNMRGIGIFTDFPSATLFSLALGADLPRADCPCAGNLRFSADGDRTRLFVTYACILSSASSRTPPGYPFAGQRNAPLPVILAYESAASVRRLAPLHCLRTGARPVSCYALFQGMAASEPTSWLSAHPHLISHSA